MQKQHYTGLPMTSMYIELSIGRGKERNVKGSNLTLTYPQFTHRTWDFSYKMNTCNASVDQQTT